METYQQLKQRQRVEFNAFEGLFFAFSNAQLIEGLAKYGLTVEDRGKVYSIGAGGFMLKTVAPAFHAMNARHAQELKDLKKAEKELIAAIAYELANHEYCITYDPQDALEALDIDRSTLDPAILKKAIKMALNESNKEELAKV